MTSPPSLESNKKIIVGDFSNNEWKESIEASNSEISFFGGSNKGSMNIKGLIERESAQQYEEVLELSENQVEDQSLILSRGTVKKSFAITDNENNKVVLEHLQDARDESDFSEKDSVTNVNKNIPCEVIVKISKPLCADYKSDSENESVDSESDSSTSTDSTTESSSEHNDSQDSDTSSSSKKKQQKEKKSQEDLSLFELPPIEDLKISVPSDACTEVGIITSIVGTLVVVESYKGSAALDVDTVLFLNQGECTLGKIFDILGPITEPVYTVRFNDEEQIKSLSIEKGMKVYYAPKTQHTTFVFLSEVLKNKGSDASWKDNIEAPSEFQDFSDDEEERLYKNKQTKATSEEHRILKDPQKSRKRSLSKTKQVSGILRPSRFGHPNFSEQRRPAFSRNPSNNQFTAQPSQFPRPRFPHHVRTPVPYNVPPFPGTNVLAASPRMFCPPLPPPPRFSGPQLPPFGGFPILNQNRNLHQPFYQQRTHAFPQAYGAAWGRQTFGVAPPPPPPPAPSSNVQEFEGKP